MSILREIVTGLLILIFLGSVAIGAIMFVANTQLKNKALTPNENATSENKALTPNENATSENKALTPNENATSENKSVQSVENPIYHTLTIHPTMLEDFVTIVPPPGEHSYMENENVVVKIEFKKTRGKYIYLMFDHWSGDVTGTTKEITVVMDSDKAIWARFSCGYLGENDYVLSGYKLMDLPVSYLVNPENPYGINENRVTAVIKRAFECWDKHTSTELFDNNVKMTGISHDKGDGLNVVFFDNNIDVCGLAYRWTGDDEITEFDIALNPKILKSDMLFGTILHEAGHALGLSHPKRVGTVMNEPHNTNNGKNLLAPGDIMGLHVLYGDNIKRG